MNARGLLHFLAFCLVVALMGAGSCGEEVETVTGEGEAIEGEAVDQSPDGPDGLKSPDNPAQFSVPACTLNLLRFLECSFRPLDC